MARLGGADGPPSFGREGGPFLGGVSGPRRAEPRSPLLAGGSVGIADGRRGRSGVRGPVGLHADPKPRPYLRAPPDSTLSTLWPEVPEGYLNLLGYLRSSPSRA